MSIDIGTAALGTLALAVLLRLWWWAHKVYKVNPTEQNLENMREIEEAIREKRKKGEQ